MNALRMFGMHLDKKISSLVTIPHFKSGIEPLMLVLKLLILLRIRKQWSKCIYQCKYLITVKPTLSMHQV